MAGFEQGRDEAAVRCGALCYAPTGSKSRLSARGRTRTGRAAVLGRWGVRALRPLEIERREMERPFVAARTFGWRLVQNRVSAPETGADRSAAVPAAGACERCGRLKSSGARWSGARWSGHSLRGVRLGGDWFRIASQRPRRARTGVWVRTLCPRRRSAAAILASGWRSPPRTTVGCCR